MPLKPFCRQFPSDTHSQICTKATGKLQVWITLITCSSSDMNSGKTKTKYSYNNYIFYELPTQTWNYTVQKQKLSQPGRNPTECWISSDSGWVQALQRESGKGALSSCLPTALKNTHIPCEFSQWVQTIQQTRWQRADVYFRMSRSCSAAVQFSQYKKSFLLISQQTGSHICLTFRKCSGYILRCPC